MTEPVWLDRLMMESFHHDLLLQHGGRPGTRDAHALESALSRPQQRWHYQPSSGLVDLAASLCHALACNHPFVDGNKRIAFAAMAVFLELNGIELTASEVEVVEMMLSLASGKSSEDALASWLRKHTVAHGAT